ncbi:sirohydrochlorin chelatase [Haloarculaceae archaeon H-GB2-1]|nr:sirohydrochlorin chelatase [Haloarculaceae archaeon H-GB1-1]MEA5387616.1 sirohydrochlorin chelatase [Haloarculaceae archaeon H-GB11]MEA5409104.1 sirohydrochlorin chelatase [Haloarculaceae archaeon H-GB2-1]
MTTALVLVGRSAAGAGDVLATHAARLRERAVADEVTTLQYDHDPVAEIADELAAVEAETVFVSPLVVEREHFPARDVERVTDRTVHVCEPLGWSPALTDAVLDRADANVSTPAAATLVLVGLGRSSASDRDLAVAYHADRIRERDVYAQVLDGYLLQNPAVECVRYDVATEEVVVVPVFPARCQATEERIPKALGFEPDGIAAPLGAHPRVTDCIQAELARERVLREGSRSVPGGAEGGPRLAADGLGDPTDP